MDKLYFAGTDLSAFGAFYDSSKTFAKPAKRIEKVSVPGKNGDLIYWDGSYENVLIPYPCFIRKNFEENFTNLMSFLHSQGGEYKTLFTSKDTSRYREGAFYEAIEPETGVWNHSGKFTLVFDCKPQRWLQSGTVNITFTSSGTITNPTYMVSKPKITIYGNGSVTVNGTVITTSGIADYVTIDCELMNCYRGSALMNDKVSFSTNDYPTLKPGTNGVTVGTGISSVVIAPMWWQL